MRHRFLPLTLGDWHGVPFLVFAPHRGARRKGDGSGFGCMILPFIFNRHPTPCRVGNVANDGAAPGMNMNVLDGDFLLATSA